MNFALFALDHATESVVSSGGPLVPFALIEADGERSLQRYVGAISKTPSNRHETRYAPRPVSPEPQSPGMATSLLTASERTLS
jgi:hypothetical protein